MKMKNDKSDSTTDSSEDSPVDHRRLRLAGNQNATKLERKIEIGWFDFDFTRMEYHQVKSLIKGGGTRGVTALKAWKPKDILEHAQKFFFPKGTSKRGKLSQFNFELRDFSAQNIPDESTVGDMYESTNVKMLRYYMFTKRNDQGYESDDLCSPKRKSSKSLKAKNRAYSDDEESLPELTAPRKSTTPVPNQPLILDETQLYSLPDLEIPTENTSPRSDTCEPHSFNDIQLQTSGSSAILGSDTPTTSSAYMLVDDEINFRLTDENTNVITVRNPAETVSIYFGIGDDFGDAPIPLNVPIRNIDEEQIVLPNTPPPSAQKVRFHQGNIFQELINLYKEENFQLDESIYKVERVLPNGETEKGEGIGLIRDIFTEFWDSFYSKCNGSDLKVPILRHDMGEEEWQAVGRIILNGYKLMEYFPIRLAKPLFEDALFGENLTDLTEVFLQIVPPAEQIVLRNAVENFDATDFEELCDILSSHDCLKLPNAGNIKGILKEISHKEILQEPKFIIECWKPVLRTFLQMKRSDLDEIYEKKIPTVKKVLQLIKFPTDMDFIQQTTANHLKRFVRSLDKQHLEAFIRFCTGSNILSEEIKVEFNKMDGFGRRPSAQTCGCVLKIPTTYDSFTEMREEFKNILTSNVWEMGYV